MKTHKVKSNRFIFSGAFGLAIVQTVGAATTIITNDATGGNNANRNTAVAADYGSNIAANSGDFTVTDGGTPNISLQWAPDASFYWEHYNWNGNSGAIQVDSNQVQTVTFTPAIGFAVTVTSADFDFWSAKDGWTIDWSVVGDGSTNLSGVFSSSLAQRRETVFFNASGAINEVLTLSIQQTHGQYRGSFAIDNLTFSQVPEPASTALLGLGLGAMAMRRNRK